MVQNQIELLANIKDLLCDLQFNKNYLKYICKHFFSCSVDFYPPPPPIIWFLNMLREGQKML